MSECIDIKLLCNRFMKEWFDHTEWWFEKKDEYDAYITKTFGCLLDNVISINSSNDDVLCCIILFDQIPRHVYRHEFANHIIEYYLQKAIYLIEIYKDIFVPINDMEFMFFWLPYRHTNKYQYVLEVMTRCWNRVQESGMTPILKKYITATYSKMNCKYQQELLKINDADMIEHVFDDFNNILAYDASYVVIDYDITPIMKKYKNCLSKICTNIIIVSLSGGVDSMVALQLLQEHFDSCTYKLL